MRLPTPVFREPRLRTTLRRYWHDVGDMASAVDLQSLETAATMLLECQARGRVVFIAGNGGSAATASHFACDLGKGTRHNGPPTFRVVALTDNMPVLTAWANDNGYERIFAEQLRSLARAGDLVVLISASGNSPNILATAEEARTLGMASIGLTGRCGGSLAHMVDLAVRVPADQIEVVEDAHLVIAHSLCVAARERLRAPGRGIRREGQERAPVQLAGD